MDSIHRKAVTFIEDYSIPKMTAKKMKKIIKSEGYRIIYYNKRDNSEDVSFLLSSLGLSAAVQRRDCCVYQDQYAKYIFLNETLSDRETAILLLHEMAHIYLGHLRQNNSYSLKEENEAHYFSYVVQDRLKHRYKRRNIGKALVALFLYCAVFFCSFTSAHYQIMVVSEFGSKFSPECQHVKDVSMTASEVK